MRQMLLGAIAGTIFGLTLAGGVSVYSQQPSWYQDTLQGQWEQRRQIDELRYQQFDHELRQLAPAPYINPYRSPC